MATTDTAGSEEQHHPTPEQIYLYEKMLSAYQSSNEHLLQLLRDNEKHPEGFELLSAVLEQLEKKTHFEQRRETERDNITSAISELVLEILNEMGSYEESCIDFELLNAGGYFEGTKIYFPDEYDFVVDICALSSFFKRKTGDEVKIDYWKEDSTRVNVRVIGDLDPAVSIFCPKPITENVDVMNIQMKSGPPGLIMNKKFAKLFTLTFKKVMISFIEKGFKITQTTGTMQIMPDLVDIMGEVVHDSFLPFYCLWLPKNGSEPIGISVDVTPSFRVSSDYPDFSSKYININALKAVSERIGKEKCYVRLVLRDDDQWRLSLSHTETELIREDDEIHRKCARILKMLKEGKYLTMKEGQMPNVKYMDAKARCSKFTEMCTSYAVKTAVLKHIMCCEKRTRTLSTCLISILLDVEETVKSGEFSGFFLGINRNESACTGQWEEETLTFLTNLNNIIIDVLEERKQNIEMVVNQICEEKEKCLTDIYTSENYKELEEWYIGHF